MIILSNILGCLFWGVVVAIAATGLVYYICNQFGHNIKNLGVIAILTLLFIFSGAQGCMLSGALYLKDYVGIVHDMVEQMIPAEEVRNATNAAEELYSSITDEYPIITPFVSKIDLTALQNYVDEGGEVADYVATEINNILNSYVLRRVLWLVGLMIVATAAIIMFVKKRNIYSSGSSLSDDYDTGNSLSSYDYD